MKSCYMCAQAKFLTILLASILLPVPQRPWSYLRTFFADHLEDWSWSYLHKMQPVKQPHSSHHFNTHRRLEQATQRHIGPHHLNLQTTSDSAVRKTRRSSFHKLGPRTEKTLDKYLPCNILCNVVHLFV